MNFVPTRNLSCCIGPSRTVMVSYCLQNIADDGLRFCTWVILKGRCPAEKIGVVCSRMPSIPRFDLSMYLGCKSPKRARRARQFQVVAVSDFCYDCNSVADQMANHCSTISGWE